MADHRITRESLTAAGACWLDADAEPGADRETLQRLIPEGGLLVTVAAVRQALDAGVSPDDAHWALAHAAGADDATLRLHACWCARQALSLVESPDPRSLAAVDVAERHARGTASDAELAAARDAAWDAAWDAACIDLAGRLEVASA